MKKFVIVVIILAGAWFAWGYMKRGDAAADADMAAEAMVIRTVVVERDSIDLTVSTTGRVTPNFEVEIKSKASGQITELPFDISDIVTSGSLLAQLDPVDEMRNVSLRESALESAKARRAQAEENLRIAKITLDTNTSSAQAEVAAAAIRSQDAKARHARAAELFQKNLLSKEQLDAAQSEAASADNSLRQAEIRLQETATLPRTLRIREQEVILAQTNVKQAEVDLQTAMQRLSETKLYAPIDGVVTKRDVQIGQIIASGISNVGGGTTLMTLSDLSRLYSLATVDESDIGKVSVGQEAVITADAFIGQRFQGKVVRVASKGINTNNVVTFEVKIEILGEGRTSLRPEMTTNIEIAADRRENVLTLPNEAIQVGRRGSYVELPGPNDQNTSKTIKTGLTDGLKTEIVEGLEEGTEVAIPERVLSRWARAEGGQQNQTFARSMQRAAFMAARPGGTGGGRR